MDSHCTVLPQPVAEAGATRDHLRPGVGMGAFLQLRKLLFGPETCSSVHAAYAVSWVVEGWGLGAVGFWGMSGGVE